MSNQTLLQTIDWSTVRALPKLIPIKSADGQTPKVRTRIVKVIVKHNNQQPNTPMSNVLPRNWTANRISQIISMNPAASSTPEPSTSTGRTGTGPEDDSFKSLLYESDSD